MRILLVGNYIPDRQQSMQRFAEVMGNGLKEAGQDVTILRPPVIFGAIPVLPRVVGKWLGYIDKFFIFPLLLRRAARHCDVVHVCDHSNAMYTRYLQDRPNVVTCHDTLAIRSALGEFTRNPTRGPGRKFQQLITNGLRRAQQIVCVSETTRGDAATIIKCPLGRLSLVYNGFNYPYYPMIREEAEARLRAIGLQPAAPYLLHVGNNSWYKNRMSVLRIFSHLSQYESSKKQSLILVGPPCDFEMKQFIREQKLEHRIRNLTNINNEDLCAFYSIADALLFPSLEEGFGWPIIEAQACGCPVITSNRRAMAEIAGEAALFIDPEDPESAAASIARRWSELAELRSIGLRNVRRFSTPQMIDGYLKAYQVVRQEFVDHSLDLQGKA